MSAHLGQLNAAADKSDVLTFFELILSSKGLLCPVMNQMVHEEGFGASCTNVLFHPFAQAHYLVPNAGIASPKQS